MTTAVSDVDIESTEAVDAAVVGVRDDSCKCLISTLSETDSIRPQRKYR